MEHIPAIDLPEALNRAMGDVEFLRMLLNEFRNTIPDFLTRLKKAQQDRDMVALAQNAHRLKGAAANLSAKAIAAAALKLEQIGKSGCPDECEQALAELNKTVQSFNQDLIRIDWKMVGTAR